jgi:hypothetical protein
MSERYMSLDAVARESEFSRAEIVECIRLYNSISCEENQWKLPILEEDWTWERDVDWLLDQLAFWWMGWNAESERYHGSRFDWIREQVSPRGDGVGGSGSDGCKLRRPRKPKKLVVNERGYFYAIQTMPDVMPNRIKLGFTNDLGWRLRSFRTVVPTAVLLKAWPCLKRWETIAIASVTQIGVRDSRCEVFDFPSLEDLVGRADAFFAAMPPMG